MTLLLRSSDSLSQLWHSLEEISNESNGSNLENGSLGVLDWSKASVSSRRRARSVMSGTDLVDSNDHLGILHTGKVLDSSTDSHGNVELGSYDLSSLSDLLGVVGVTRIDSGSGSSNTGVQSVGEGEDERIKVVLGLESTAPRHDGRGRSEIGSLGDGQSLRYPLGGSCTIKLGFSSRTMVEQAGSNSPSPSPVASALSTSPAASPRAAASQLAARTVKILTSSVDSTVAMADPA